MRAHTFIVVPLLLAGACQNRTYHESQPEQAAPARSAKDIINAEAARFAQAQYQIFDNHDQTLHRLTGLYNAGKLRKDPKRTLVHFDYHSDMYRNNSHLEGNVNIGNYINTLIVDQHIDEVWWILPDATRSTTALSREWGCASIRSQNDIYWGRPNTYRDWQFRDGPADQLICVSAQGRFSFKAATASCANGERTVKVFKRTIGDLLNAPTAPIPGPTILDVDADFFDMSGLYANEDPNSPGANIGPSPKCYNLHYSAERLEEEFRRFATVITEKMDLRPDYLAVARSPGYTQQNKEKIFSFLQHIGSKAQASGGGGGGAPCSATTYDARICLNAGQFPVYNASGRQIGTAKAGEPVCKTNKNAGGRTSAFFLLPPPGEAYLPPEKLCSCDVAQLQACIRGGGERLEAGECRNRHCR